MSDDRSSTSLAESALESPDDDQLISRAVCWSSDDSNPTTEYMHIGLREALAIEREKNRILGTNLETLRAELVLVKADLKKKNKQLILLGICSIALAGILGVNIISHKSFHLKMLND